MSKISRCSLRRADHPKEQAAVPAVPVVYCRTHRSTMDKAAKDAPLAFKFMPMDVSGKERTFAALGLTASNDIKSLVNHELILRILCTWPTKQATHKGYIQVFALSRAP